MSFCFCLLSALAARFADIFFLVDSGIAQGQLAVFKSEFVKLINQLNAGASTYRVGLAQYSQDIMPEFLLNKFQTKQQILAGVKRFRLRPQPNQPRNLGSALQYANTHFFTREAGGRAHQDFRQFLVVVSGKGSDDPVSIVAREIKSEGITVVGMSAGAPMEAIDLFASPGYAFDSTTLSILTDFFMTEKLETITEGEKHHLSFLWALTHLTSSCISCFVIFQLASGGHCTAAARTASQINVF